MYNPQAFPFFSRRKADRKRKRKREREKVDAERGDRE
jgi:hypothetical protein